MKLVYWIWISDVKRYLKLIENIKLFGIKYKGMRLYKILQIKTVEVKLTEY